MKKSIFLIFLIYNISYSQTFKSILDSLTVNSHIKCYVSENNNKFVLGQGIISEKNINSIYPIYMPNGDNSEFYLVLIGSTPRFKLYCFDHIDTLELEVGTCNTTDGTDLLLFDNKDLSVYYLESSATINICKIEDDVLTYTTSLDSIYDRIIKLDNYFMPITSLENTQEHNKLKFSTFKKTNNSFDREINYINVDSNNKLFLLQYQNLFSILNSKPKKFELKEGCIKRYCDSKISRFFMD